MTDYVTILRKQIQNDFCAVVFAADRATFNTAIEVFRADIQEGADHQFWTGTAASPEKTNKPSKVLLGQLSALTSLRPDDKYWKDVTALMPTYVVGTCVAPSEPSSTPCCCGDVLLASTAHLSGQQSQLTTSGNQVTALDRVLSEASRPVGASANRTSLHFVESIDSMLQTNLVQCGLSEQACLESLSADAQRGVGTKPNRNTLRLHEAKLADDTANPADGSPQIRNIALQKMVGEMPNERSTLVVAGIERYLDDEVDTTRSSLARIHAMCVARDLISRH